MNKYSLLMRIVLFFLILVTGLSVAEVGVYYTSEEDIYYHAYSHCDFREDLRAASSTEVEYKFPCNICVQDDTEYDDIKAMHVGNLVIIRVSDNWMRSISDVSEIFADTSPEYMEGDELRYSARRLLHGEDYVRFMDSYMAGEDAVLPAYFIDFSYVPGQHNLGDYRFNYHIGSCWHALISCEENESIRSGFWYGIPRFFCGQANLIDGVYFEHITDEWSYVEYEIIDRQVIYDYYEWPLTDISGCLSYSYENEIEKLELYTFDRLNLLKYTRKEVGSTIASSSDYYTLYIDGKPYTLTSEALVEEHDAVNWCVLTDAEASLIAGGESVSLVEGVCPVEHFSVQGTAILTQNCPGYGSLWESLADRDGVEIVHKAKDINKIGDKYICQLDNHSLYRGSGDLGKGILVLDADTLNLLAFYSEGECLQLTQQFDGANNAIFVNRSYSEGKAYIVDVDSLAVLKEFDFDSGEADMPVNGNGYWQINVEYPREVGKPQRMVLSNGETFWLGDNYGHRITEDYEILEPVLWYKDNGLFCMQTGTSRTAQYPKELYNHGYRGQKLLAMWNYDMEDDRLVSTENPEWRCGVIDKDGNVLAECIYCEIRIISDSAVELTKVNGETVLIDLKD